MASSPYGGRSAGRRLPARPRSGGCVPSPGGKGGAAGRIAGDALATATAVAFGSTAGSIVSNTNTEVVATAPPEAAGAVDVQVTTIGGTSATSSADRFTYVAPVPPPRIATVSSVS